VARYIQLRIFYLAELSFRIEGDIKSFLDKQKLKKYIITKLALHKMADGLLQAEKKRC